LLIETTRGFEKGTRLAIHAVVLPRLPSIHHMLKR
jgi:hypothetical protein